MGQSNPETPPSRQHQRWVLQGAAVIAALMAVTGCSTQSNPTPCGLAVNAGQDQAVPLGATVQLSGSWPSTTTNATRVSALWIFLSKPSGSSAALSAANGPMPTFVADSAGTYVVRLGISTTERNCSPSSISDSVMVTAGQLVAHTGPDQTVDVGTTVTLDGTGSIGNIQSYTWTLITRHGLSTAPSSGTGDTLTFVLDEPDDLEYQLVVDDGTMKDTTVTLVHTTFPTITLLTPNQGPVGTRVTITGANFSPTLSQNAITFSTGVSAPVLTSTITQIEVDVPAGAITGAVRGQFLGRLMAPNTSNALGPTFTVTTPTPATWMHVNTSLAETLNGVATPDANTAFVVGTNGTIVSTTDAGVTWSAPHTTNTMIELLDVDFTSLLVGVAVGRTGTILRTTDGGATPWATIASGVTLSISDVSFIDAATGWAAVGAPVGNAPLLRTTDGGATWTTVMPPGMTFFCCNAVSFAPGGVVGVAVGQSGDILRTVDGGTNWAPQTVLPVANLLGAIMADAQTGWVVGDSGSPRHPVVMKTTDGGMSWNSQTLPGNVAMLTLALASIHAVDVMNATIAGQGSGILRTENGGTTWVAEGTVPPPNNWLDVAFPPGNAVNGMAVAGGAIARRQ